MSTILDALEKASRKSGSGGSASSGPSLRERQLEKEVERSRRTAVLAAIGIVVVGVGGFVAQSLMSGSSAPPATATRPVGTRGDGPSPVPAQARGAATPSPAPTPAPTAAPSATPPPSPIPQPTSAPPTPTPQAPRPQVATTTAAALKPYLKDGQLLIAADLGWKIEGVMEMGDTSFAMIDGEQVQTGTMFRGYHLVGVTTGLLTFDLGDGRIVKVAY